MSPLVGLQRIRGIVLVFVFCLLLVHSLRLRDIASGDGKPLYRVTLVETRSAIHLEQRYFVLASS